MGTRREDSQVLFGFDCKMLSPEAKAIEEDWGFREALLEVVERRAGKLDVNWAPTLELVDSGDPRQVAQDFLENSGGDGSITIDGNHPCECQARPEHWEVICGFRAMLGDRPWNAIEAVDAYVAKSGVTVDAAIRDEFATLELKLIVVTKVYPA